MMYSVVYQTILRTAISVSLTTGRKLRPKLFRETYEPVLRRSSTRVNSIKVFIVDINAVKLSIMTSVAHSIIPLRTNKTHVILLHESSNSVRSTHRIRTFTSRSIRRSKSRNHQANSVVVVIGDDGRTSSSVELGPFQSFIGWTGEEKEREDEDVEAF